MASTIKYRACGISAGLLLALFSMCNGAPRKVSTNSKELEFEANDTLRFLQVIFRHGARSPEVIYEGDPNNAFWEQGLGELTNKGMDNEYQLGVWLGNRYRKHLGSVYLRSTDRDRTLASAQLVAAGIFPPAEKDKWNAKLGQLWKPMPVHTVPKNMDPFVDNFIVEHCQRYVQLLSIFSMTPKGKRILKNNDDIIRVVVDATGHKIDSLYDFLYPCDVYLTEAEHNLQPPFAKPIADRLIALCDYLSFVYLATHEMTSLAGGFLIKEIVDRFFDVAAGKLKNMNSYFYSAHDYSIMLVLATMDLFNYINPPYSSVLLLELHERPEGQFFIKILYRNDTNREPYLLRVPDCDDECPLQHILSVTQPYFIDDLQEACRPFTREELAEKQKECNIDLP